MKERTKRRNVLEPLQAAPLSPLFWIAGVVILAGQAAIGFGKSTLDVRVVAGTIMAIVGAIVLVFSSRDREEPFRQQMVHRAFKTDWLPSVLTLVLLVVTSWLNFRTIRIGLSEDESFEWVRGGLVAMKQGWLWWGHIDQVLEQNVSALCSLVLGPTHKSLKCAAFLFRTGSGVFAWLLARELYGSRTGNLVGWIVGTSVMYMCSFNDVVKEISAPVTFMACLYLAFMGVRRKSLPVLLASGACCALGYYAYVSFYPFFAGLVLWGLAVLISPQKRMVLRSNWKLLIGWWAGFVLMMTPAVYYMFKYPYLQAHFPFATAAAKDQSTLHSGGLLMYASTLWQEVLGTVYKGSRFFTTNFDSRPMLWVPWAAGFWVGLVLMLRRLRESRMFIILCLMAAFLAFAALNHTYTPNWKISRPAMLLSTFPAAIGVQYACFCMGGRRYRGLFRWVPLLIALASVAYGVTQMRNVMTNPVSWWFQAANTIAPREEFVYAHPEYRFWEIGAPIADVRSNSPVTTVCSVRHVLETPNDGRDVVFLFPHGRQEWIPRIERAAKVWMSIYPGGETQVHTVPVKGGQWPTFISYRVPVSARWWLPPVDVGSDVREQADAWWSRARLLHQHGLELEAWRDALKAAHLEETYYGKADTLLGNPAGREGRLAILLKGQLWNEALEELDFWSNRGTLSSKEVGWKQFLDSHGMEMRWYSTFTASEPARRVVRQYMPTMHLGLRSLSSALHLCGAFPARVTGRLFIPHDGNYSFDVIGGDQQAKTIMIDGETVQEVSCRDLSRSYVRSRTVHLTRGMHEFMAENCTFLRYRGEIPQPPLDPDPLNFLYGFEPCWELTWQVEDGPIVPIPPEFLYAPDASETPMPDWPF